ncbi:MAG: DsbA family protein [Candidatus Moranbacteria bacterium]|jgi:protein-disulfide isomerase|nr:DsbA family protein [Candidatus Moranbacteria bacterium]
MEEMMQEEKERGISPLKASKDAWLVSGAILLASVIVSVSVVFGGNFLKKSDADVKTAETADPKKPAEVTVTQDQVKGLFTEKNLMFGDKNSDVLFVEFSDPSCPYCSIAAGKNPNLNKQAGPQFLMAKDGGSYVPPVPEMKKLVDSGKAAFVWLYANGHGNGELGTKAMYCAQEKKKFWEVHDLLMSEAGYKLLNETVKNDISKASVMADFLKSAVPSADMKACLESGKYDSRPAEDMAVAKQFGFSGTPSFFVNTKHFGGAYSFKDMQSAVDSAK